MTPEIKQRIEQIRRGEVPEGYKKTKVGIVPCEWNLYRISEISTEVHECAGVSNYETLSISAGIGFVNQAKKFGKEISGAQYAKYTVLHRGDFSYNKGNSKKYPQGCIYQLKDREFAAVPNVFESFRLTKGYNDYFEQLFMYGFLNSQLFSKINHGVRDDGLLNLRGDDFYSSYITFPSLTEQKRIAEILSVQDKVIALKERLLEEKKRQKKALMQQLLTGKKRLLEFNDEWHTITLSQVSKKVTIKNTGFKHNLVFSNSAQNGIVPQSEQFDKDIANDENIDKYYVVTEGCFVYNPRISVTAPCGPINVNHNVNTGVMSPLYTVFYVESDVVDNDYLEQYFKSSVWFNYMKSVANYGARHDRMSVTDDDFFNMPITIGNLEEQLAIKHILMELDGEIELLQKVYDREKQKKKALMQLLLTGIVRVN